MPSSPPQPAPVRGGAGDDGLPASRHARADDGTTHKRKRDPPGSDDRLPTKSGFLATLRGPMALTALFLGILVPLGAKTYSRGAAGAAPPYVAPPMPSLTQFVDQKSFNVLEEVLPPSEANATTTFVWPGVTEKSLTAKPFHIYDDAFYDVIGTEPTLTLLAETASDPVFHEAVVWYPPTNEVFFVQNAGHPDAGTGLNKSSIIQKISLAQAEAMKTAENAVGKIDVTLVPSDPQVINPNGGVYYEGNIIFAGEGQGDRITSALYLMNPQEPYNTTVLLNNYFGRQFSSLNDIAIHPTTKEIYFTDTLYGYLQDFRPAPGLRPQVYRMKPVTGAVTVVADGFTLPNGLSFSPDGKYAYVTDTGINHGFFGYNLSDPSSIYRFDVKEDGTFENRKTFAFVASGVPDGVHCDARGNVYAGCGDGVHVWNPAGTLIGKIYLGTGVANFQFAGPNGLVMCAETQLYYATLNVSGPPLV